MNLDETQRQKVAEWIAQGLKLSDIQNRLASELGLRLTYMEVRLLVDDLKLTPKDAEPPGSPAPVLPSPGSSSGAGKRAPEDWSHTEPGTPLPGAVGQGSVSVTVDEITRPGAVVSGKATFSDGNTAAWQIDQMGQLGLIPTKAGYRPPASDVEQFQFALESELSKLGL